VCRFCTIYVMEGAVTAILGFKERCKHTHASFFCVQDSYVTYPIFPALTFLFTPTVYYTRITTPHRVNALTQYGLLTHEYPWNAAVPRNLSCQLVYLYTISKQKQSMQQNLLHVTICCLLVLTLYVVHKSIRISRCSFHPVNGVTFPTLDVHRTKCGT